MPDSPSQIERTAHDRATKRNGATIAAPFPSMLYLAVPGLAIPCRTQPRLAPPSPTALCQTRPVHAVPHLAYLISGRRPPDRTPSPEGERVAIPYQTLPRLTLPRHTIPCPTLPNHALPRPALPYLSSAPNQLAPVRRNDAVS